MKKIKYDVNETYFEKIDTDEKAYWLGFLYADGHNSEYPNWRITLKLQNRDMEHVKKFNSVLYPTNDKKITIRKSDGSVESIIHSKKICEDLSKLNVVNKKSLTIKFPDSTMVPDNLLVYFIQGLFDGDGSVSLTAKTKTPCACLDFSGSLNLIKQLKIVLKEKTGIEFGYKERKYVNTIAVIYIKGNDKVLKFLNWLYFDSKFALPRKYQKYQYIKQIKQNVIDNKFYKYRGVYVKRNKPHASIQYNNKTYYLGVFDTEKNAAIAYNKKALELMGEKAILNIID